MAKKCYATISDIGEYISYDPETGVFMWKKRNGSSCKMGVPIGVPERYGHLRVCFRKNYIKLHQLAFYLINGEWPNGPVDHINGISSDNRFSNLRIVNDRINRENLRKPMSHNANGMLGVTWHKRRKKWQAQIQVNKRHIYLGIFESAEDAQNAYLTAKRKLHEGCTI